MQEQNDFKSLWLEMTFNNNFRCSEVGCTNIIKLAPGSINFKNASVGAFGGNMPLTQEGSDWKIIKNTKICNL